MNSISRKYDALENPFTYGLTHKSFNYTNKHCGLLQPNEDYQLVEFDLLNKKEFAAWCVGRAINFPISIISAITDFVLQIFEIISISFEMLAIKIESLTRGKKANQTISYYLYENFSFSLLFFKMRRITTLSIRLLARDFCIIAPDEKISSLSAKYTQFIKKFV